MGNQTQQKMFDEAAKALIKQGGPSFELGSCLYEGTDGKRCAVGWLFNDEELEVVKKLKTPTTISGLIEKPQIANKLRAKFRNEVSFLKNLQEAHDQASFSYPDDWIKEWATHMRMVAAEFGLSVAVMESALNERAKALAAKNDPTER